MEEQMTPQRRRRQTVTGVVMIVAWFVMAAGWIVAYAIGKCGKLGLTVGMLFCAYGLMNAVQTIVAARKGTCEEVCKSDRKEEDK